MWKRGQFLLAYVHFYVYIYGSIYYLHIDTVQNCALIFRVSCPLESGDSVDSLQAQNTHTTKPPVCHALSNLSMRRTSQSYLSHPSYLKII